ncbi:uncharacterized protein GBIM_03069 [Gryllus bimaculatus]|nr:uncharacterized protein GBIM_03069 [Gryllus bimaculatus]
MVIQRVLWFIGLSIALVACSWLMYDTYSRWVQSPVISTTDETQRAEDKRGAGSFSAAFHACVIQRVFKGCDLNSIPSKLQTLFIFLFRMNIFLKLQMVCTVSIAEEDMGEIVDNATANIIENHALNKEDVICDADTLGTKAQFQSVLTEEGVCFTYNMIPGTDLFREGTFQANRNKNISSPKTNVTWDPVNGYQKSSDNCYPHTASGLGRNAGLWLLLHTKTKELHSLCNLMGHGFKVILHSPIDFPQSEHESVHVSLENVFHLALTPHEMRTAPRLRHSYSPQQRQCYFPDERYLKYFKYYSQRNCELECLSNQTLEKCGCVEFYLPRMPNTPVCGWKSKACIEKAKVDLYKTAAFPSGSQGKIDSSLKYTLTCKCFPSCTHIWYKSTWSTSEMSQQIKKHFFGRCMKRNEEDIRRSILFVYYKDPLFIPIRRVEVFGTTDLLASMGGLMGLCMGISLLSVIEFFYWMLIRPFCQRIKQSNPQLRSIRKAFTKDNVEASVQYSKHLDEKAENQQGP